MRAFVLLALVLTGCASTSVEFTPAAPKTPVCQEHLTALVLWGPEWRAEQKDVPLREQAAAEGIRNFFAESGCFANTEIRRLSMKQETRADRVLVITVRELGPVLKLLSSWALVDGGTEVVLKIAAHDQEFNVHWQNGGHGVVKGVATLPADMQAALTAALKPAVIAK